MNNKSSVNVLKLNSPDEIHKEVKRLGDSIIRRLMVMQIELQELQFNTPADALEVHDCIDNLSQLLESCEDDADDLALNGLHGFN